MMKIILTLLCAALVCCCVSNSDQNFDDLKKIKLKMTIEQVHSAMRNKPLNFETAPWVDSLLVENYESPIGASDHYKVIYLKRDSTVVRVEWGD